MTATPRTAPPRTGRVAGGPPPPPPSGPGGRRRPPAAPPPEDAPRRDMFDDSQTPDADADPDGGAWLWAAFLWLAWVAIVGAFVWGYYQLSSPLEPGFTAEVEAIDFHERVVALALVLAPLPLLLMGAVVSRDIGRFRRGAVDVLTQSRALTPPPAASDPRPLYGQIFHEAPAHISHEIQRATYAVDALHAQLRNIEDAFAKQSAAVDAAADRAEQRVQAITSMLRDEREAFERLLTPFHPNDNGARFSGPLMSDAAAREALDALRMQTSALETQVAQSGEMIAALAAEARRVDAEADKADKADKADRDRESRAALVDAQKKLEVVAGRMTNAIEAAAANAARLIADAAHAAAQAESVSDAGPTRADAAQERAQMRRAHLSELRRHVDRLRQAERASAQVHAQDVALAPSSPIAAREAAADASQRRMTRPVAPPRVDAPASGAARSGASDEGKRQTAPTAPKAPKARPAASSGLFTVNGRAQDDFWDQGKGGDGGPSDGLNNGPNDGEGGRPRPDPGPPDHRKTGARQTDPRQTDPRQTDPRQTDPKQTDLGQNNGDAVVTAESASTADADIPPPAARSAPDARDDNQPAAISPSVDAYFDLDGETTGRPDALADRAASARPGSRRRMDWGKLIKAANFPDSENDHEALDAWYDVLTDAQAAALLQSSEDAIGALEELDVYIETAAPEMAPVNVWRAYLDGDRATAEDLIRGHDPVDRARIARRLEQDPALVGLSTKFCDRYEDILRRMIREEVDDALLIEMATTRTGRAYLVMAAAAGRFGRGQG